MSHRRRTVALAQTVVPDYRTRFFEDLSRAIGPGLLLLSGEEDWQPDVRHVGAVPYVPVRNVFLARRRLLWQVGALRPLLAADVAVMSLNPRILSNWLAVIARRLLGRRTVLWGHAWPRRGRKSRTNRVRGLMRRIADTLIVYTETEAHELAGELRKKAVHAAPNALYRRMELSEAGPSITRTDLVFVGRLTLSKKPDLLLDGFTAALPDLPSDIRLVFVGDGPLRSELEDRSRFSGTESRVLFMGHMSSLADVRSIYARAIASVSPGDVGLSLIQSLGFGVPMIINLSANHGPELEAAVEGENAVYFRSNSSTEVASVIVRFVDDRERWIVRREAIAESTRTRYSVEAMVSSFISSLSLTPHDS